jgi:hypothetical protein
MENYYSGNVPWYSSRASITTLVIASGVN